MTITQENLEDYSVTDATSVLGTLETIRKGFDALLTTVPERSLSFYRLLLRIGELHRKKNQDYGTDTDPFANVRASQEFGVAPWIGALIRLNDKIVRLKSFARKGKLENESAKDSMLDIAVYALIALILYEEDENQGMEKVGWLGD